jgi:hypothetical protein
MLSLEAPEIGFLSARVTPSLEAITICAEQALQQVRS